MSTSTTPSPAAEPDGARPVIGVDAAAPAVRIGMLAGLTGILCCVGPTVLAMVGVVGAGTAYAWANTLYDGYAWFFRLAGLLVLGGLVAWSLKRRNQCTLAGARRGVAELTMSLGVRRPHLRPPLRPDHLARHVRLSRPGHRAPQPHRTCPEHRSCVPPDLTPRHHPVAPYETTPIRVPAPIMISGLFGRRRSDQRGTSGRPCEIQDARTTPASSALPTTARATFLGEVARSGRRAAASGQATAVTRGARRQVVVGCVSARTSHPAAAAKLHPARVSRPASPARAAALIRLRSDARCGEHLPGCRVDLGVVADNHGRHRPLPRDTEPTSAAARRDPPRCPPLMRSTPAAIEFATQNSADAASRPPVDSSAPGLVVAALSLATAAGQVKDERHRHARREPGHRSRRRRAP